MGNCLSSTEVESAPTKDEIIAITTPCTNKTSATVITDGTVSKYKSEYKTSRSKSKINMYRSRADKIETKTKVVTYDKPSPIKKKKLEKIKAIKVTSDTANCPICKNKLMEICIECAYEKSSDMISKSQCFNAGNANCQHIYHWHCINRWLKTRDSCFLDNILWKFQLETDTNDNDDNLNDNDIGNDTKAVRLKKIKKTKKKSKSFNNVSFKSSYSEILAECERFHTCNLDKLRLNELCVCCNGYYQELDFYSKAIENDTNSINLLPIKYILLSYLVHSKIEYYTKIKNTFPKYQIIMDDWNRYSLNHSKLKRSINILKKQINTLNMNEFINLLFTLQPWMTAQNLYSIIQFQEKNNPLCNGCGVAKLKGKYDTIWCCHMAIKIVFLLYFTVNLWVDTGTYWQKISGYIQSHQISACDWYWNVSKDARYIQFFGNQIIPIHIVNEIRKEKGKDINDETLVEYCMKPSIVPIKTFETIKTEYLQELKRGFNVYNKSNPVYSVSVANELGVVNVCRV